MNDDPGEWRILQLLALGMAMMVGAATAIILHTAGAGQIVSALATGAAAFVTVRLILVLNRQN